MSTFYLFSNLLNYLKQEQIAAKQSSLVQYSTKAYPLQQKVRPTNSVQKTQWVKSFHQVQVSMQKNSQKLLVVVLKGDLHGWIHLMWGCSNINELDGTQERLELQWHYCQAADMPILILAFQNLIKFIWSIIHP